MGAKTLGFGQPVPGTSNNNFLRLKQKGDKVQFRFSQEPAFYAKHFIALTDEQTGQKRWEVPECPRIMNGDDCDTCVEFFKIKAKQKKLLNGRQKDALEKEERQEFNRLDLQARDFAPTIEHYFSILDRGDGKFKILQTTNGVKNKFNAYMEQGVDVFDTEWVLSNTGSASPAERYLLTPVDSKKAEAIKPEEEEEWAKAASYDLSQVASGGSQEDNY